MTSLVINLPYPPSANHLWRISNRRIIRSKEYELWLAANSWGVKTQRKGVRVGGPFTIRLFVGKPDGRRRDLDNTIKPLMDLIVKGGAVEDDSLCQRIECEWRPDVSGVKAMIMATEPA